MPTSDGHSTREAAKLIGISHATLVRWVKDGLVPTYQNQAGHARLAEATVADLATLRQAHPGYKTKLALRGRKLNAISIGTAAKRIGISASAMQKWTYNTLDRIHYLPETLVDHLAKINQELNLHMAGKKLKVSPGRIKRWAAKNWIRHWTLPGGQDRYSLEDIAFWQDQMRKPWEHRAVLSLFRAPVVVIDELMLHTKESQLSRAAQLLAEHTSSGLLQAALAFRRRILAHEGPTEAN
jgi:transposase-like protein